MTEFKTMVEFGTFVGYTATRMGRQVELTYAKGYEDGTILYEDSRLQGCNRVTTMELDPVHACIARHVLDIARPWCLDTGCIRALDGLTLFQNVGHMATHANIPRTPMSVPLKLHTNTGLCKFSTSPHRRTQRVCRCGGTLQLNACWNATFERCRCSPHQWRQLWGMPRF